MTVFIPCSDKLYPTDTYGDAALILKLIASRHEIDINDPAHIREYYRELYRKFCRDKKALVKAINDRDFAETAKQYRFIPSQGANVLVPYGGCTELYEELVSETGFDDDDLRALFEAILNMYEHDRSASKGEMSVISPLIIFRHIGTDSDEKQRSRQSMLGCAPAHKLFDLVHAEKKSEVEFARNYTDYDCSIALSDLPNGIEAGFLRDPYSEISWGKIPEGCSWLRQL